MRKRGRTRCAYLWQHFVANKKKTELDEKTRFAAFFKTSCVRSTEYVTLADEVPSETGRLKKKEVQKKRQEYQQSKKHSRGMILGDEEKPICATEQMIRWESRARLPKMLRKSGARLIADKGLVQREKARRG